MIHTDGTPTIANAPRRAVQAEPVQAWHAPGMYRELDQRQGGGVEIRWHLGNDGTHLVVLIGPDLLPVKVWDNLTGAEARERFLHPFADAAVPDIFKS